MPWKGVAGICRGGTDIEEKRGRIVERGDREGAVSRM